MQATPEQWRRIPGFQDYEVSNTGRVRSWLPWRGTAVPRTLVPYASGNGYLQVTLHTEGLVRKRRVHALVTEAFLGPPAQGLVIRHLDGDGTNNRLENLAYGTQSQNLRDAVAHGTHYWSRRDSCIHGHPFSPENTRILPRGTRACRVCLRASARDRYRLRKEADAAASAGRSLVLSSDGTSPVAGPDGVGGIGASAS